MDLRHSLSPGVTRWLADWEHDKIIIIIIFIIFIIIIIIVIIITC